MRKFTPLYYNISKTVEIKDFSQNMNVLLVKAKLKPKFYPKVTLGEVSL